MPVLNQDFINQKQVKILVLKEKAHALAPKALQVR